MSRMLTTSLAADAMRMTWNPPDPRHRIEEPSRSARRAARRATRGRWVGPGGV